MLYAMQMLTTYILNIIELCIFAQGIPSQPGEPVDSQPLAALELAFFENSRSNVWLCNPTYI